MAALLKARGLDAIADTVVHHCTHLASTRRRTTTVFGQARAQTGTTVLTLTAVLECHPVRQLVTCAEGVTGGAP